MNKEDPPFSSRNLEVANVVEVTGPLSRVPAGQTHKVGLVLPGGGARGAFQAGVLARLGEAKLLSKVRIVAGVSAGAINGAFLANHPDGLDQGALELAELWSNLKTPRVLSTSPLGLFGNVARWSG